MSKRQLDSPAAREALHRALKSTFTAKDLADLLFRIDENESVEKAREFLNKLGCRILGVSSLGKCIGWLIEDELDKGTICRDIMHSFDEKPILHETASFKQVILALSKDVPVFVNVMGETAAAITPCDLQDAPMRMWLFGLVTLIESLMDRAIAKSFPHDGWKTLISESRLTRAQELMEERLRRHDSVELSECLQLGDKATIMLKHKPSQEALGFKSRRQYQEFFSQLEMLRNCLAHSQQLPTDNLGILVTLALSLDPLLALSDNPILPEVIDSNDPTLPSPNRDCPQGLAAALPSQSAFVTEDNEPTLDISLAKALQAGH